MKKLFFLRHGKAAGMGDSDIFRPLTNEGKEQVKAIADHFKQGKFAVELIISSPALRAKETTELFNEINNNSQEILFESFIYEGYATEELIEYFNDLPDIVNNVLFVGHNPNISRAVMNLSKNIDIAMSPAEIVGLAFDINFWHELEARTGELCFAKKL